MPIEYRKTQQGGSCTPGCHDTKVYERGGAATVITTKDVAHESSKDQPTTRGAS
jgi:hypothetical protein